MENAGGGGDTLAGVRASSCAACSMVARVQERWMRHIAAPAVAEGGRRVEDLEPADRDEVTPCGFDVTQVDTKDLGNPGCLHQPPLIQRRSR